MLGFFTPLRGRETTHDFDSCLADLRVTATQAAIAAGGLEHVFVGTSGEDYPDFGAINVPVSGVPIPSNRREVLLDKAVKRYAAIAMALRTGDYTLFALLDADDLVSESYPDLVQSFDYTEFGGAILDRGFLFDKGLGALQRRWGMNRFCGTTLVLTKHLLESLNLLPSSLNNWELSYEKITSELDNDVLIDVLGDHVCTAGVAKSAGWPMRVISQPLVTWMVNNTNNESKTKLPPGSTSISKSFCDEFGLCTSFVREASPYERVLESARFFKSRAARFLKPVVA